MHYLGKSRLQIAAQSTRRDKAMPCLYRGGHHVCKSRRNPYVETRHCLVSTAATNRVFKSPCTNRGTDNVRTGRDLSLPDDCKSRFENAICKRNLPTQLQIPYGQVATCPWRGGKSRWQIAVQSIRRDKAMPCLYRDGNHVCKYHHPKNKVLHIVKPCFFIL